LFSAALRTRPHASEKRQGILIVVQGKEQLSPKAPEWTEFETPGNTLALHLADGPAVSSESMAPAGQCQLGFTIEDIDTFHQEMIAKGITCLQSPEEEDFGKLAEYADPDGLPFSVLEQPKRS
jgi:predicted enzyme related to lactoylglutathione lyase